MIVMTRISPKGDFLSPKKISNLEYIAAWASFSQLKFLELFLGEFPTSWKDRFPLKSFLGLLDDLLCEVQAAKLFF